MRNNDEFYLQCSIVNYFRLFDDFLVFAVPNGGSRNVLEATNLKRSGTLAGVCDLILLRKNKVYFIEIKLPNKKSKQSESQIWFEKKVKSFGFEYFILRSLNDAIEFSKYARS